MQFNNLFVLAGLTAMAIATPVELQARTGGGGGGTGGNSGTSCGNGQVLACCQSKPDDNDGGLGGALAGALQCATISADLLSLIPILGIKNPSVCKNYVACCSGDNTQNGLINLNAPCFQL